MITDTIEAGAEKITTKEIVEKYGVKAVGIAGNVAKKDDAVKLAEKAKELGEGKIWGIVNNAGIF